MLIGTYLYSGNAMLTEICPSGVICFFERPQRRKSLSTEDRRKVSGDIQRLLRRLIGSIPVDYLMGMSSVELRANFDSPKAVCMNDVLRHKRRDVQYDSAGRRAPQQDAD
jgi:hypothetical protein